MNSLWSELKRRNVVRVAIAYAVVSWVVLQLIDVLSDIVEFPEGLSQTILIMLLIGAPIVLIFSWAFEITPEGVKKTAEVDQSDSIAHGTGRRINRLIAAGLVFALAFIAYDKMGRIAGGGTKEENSGPLSIAVLPFADLSADSSQEYFGDGVAEEILNILAGMDELDVTSRTTAFSLKGQGLSIPEMAERLGVSYILEGSIRSADNRVRITAQLIQTDTDTHLWSETYDRELTDIFAIQDDISRSISSALHLKLFGDGPIRENPTDNLEAYQLYLQGHHLLMLRGEVNLRGAVERLEKAVKLDPNFAEAWVDLGMATTLIPAYSSNVNQQGFLILGNNAATRALEIKPNLATAHILKSFIAFHEGRWEDAIEPRIKARELDPRNETVWLWSAVQLSSMGYLTKALEDARKAYDIAPTTGINAGWYGFVAGYAGDTETAHKFIDEAVALGWSYAYPRKMELYLREGNKEGAKEVIAKLLEVQIEEESRLDIVIDAYFDPSLKDKARAAVLSYLDERRYYAALYGSYILGDADLVVRYLKEVSNNRGAELGFLFAPAYRKILNAPEVKTYMKEIGLVDFWKKHGWPDRCQASGDDYECSE